MSMNLIFDVKNGPGYIDFPFQTPTELTYAVLDAKTTEERIKIIEDQLVLWEWDKKEIDKIINEIKSLMSCETLELSMI